LDWLGYTYDCLLILLLVVSLIRSFKDGVRQVKYIVVYISFVIFVEFLGIYFDLVLDRSNTWIYNIYFLATLLYFSFFFYLSYRQVLLKRIIVIIPFVFLAIYFLFIPDNFFSLESDFAIKSNLILLFGFIWMCLLYFLDIIVSSDNIQLRSSFTFWVTMGFFVWSVMVLLRVAGISFFNNHDRLFLFQLASFTDIINIITYSLYLKGLLCLKLPQK